MDSLFDLWNLVVAHPYAAIGCILFACLASRGSGSGDGGGFGGDCGGDGGD